MPRCRGELRQRQHLLLLDEFYRSAMHIAGKRLLWYLVPSEV